jgi:hypothetical protein
MLTRLMTMAARIPVKNRSRNPPSRISVSENQAAISTMRPLTTSVNRPSVTTVSGRVKRRTTGRMKALTRPNTRATMRRSTQPPSISTPGTT